MEEDRDYVLFEDGEEGGLSEVDSGDSGSDGCLCGEKEVEGVGEEVVKEEELVNWAYKVMDWLKIAVEARAWDKIIDNADDIVSAFVVLVKPEHRGVVMDTFKAIARSLGGG